MSESKRKTYIYHSPTTGLIETIDEETGIIILIQKSMRDDLLGNMKDTLPYKETNGIRTRIERGVGIEERGLMLTKRWVYTETLAELIVQKVTEGKTLIDICKRVSVAGEPIMPPYFILAKWRQDRPEFNEKIEQAFKARSEVYHDKAITGAEMADDDNAVSSKIVVDTMKWSAGVDNPDRFGNKTKVSGDVDAPITFVISTGIDRSQIPEKEVIPITESVKEIE